MSLTAKIGNRYQELSLLPISSHGSVPTTVDAIIQVLAVGEQVDPSISAVSAKDLRGLRFSGQLGEMVALPGTPTVVLVGLGDPAKLANRASTIRDVVGRASRHTAPHRHLALLLREEDMEHVQASVEGALLARYRFDLLQTEAEDTRLHELSVVAADIDSSISAAIIRGRAAAAATTLARDLANAPHNHLNATLLGELASKLGTDAGLEVEIWDKERVLAEGLGGLMAVNAGSSEEPRMIRLRYVPSTTSSGSLALVGKGIMYDSGGIGLKPNNASHAQMKSDMTGAANILAAMIALPAIGGSATVTGILMCTDNMPSATATALGDVVTIRNGRSVEIVDTDAEGRVVLADGIVLAAEQLPHAIVDIATLTGSVARALGPQIAGVFGTDRRLVDELREAGRSSGENLWELPLAHEYREEINSPVADLRNVGPDGAPDGLIAPLFMHEFTTGIPWAHIDIAGTAWNVASSGWQSEGCSGFGARLLLSFAQKFSRFHPHE